MSSSSPSSATRWQKGCVCANCLWAVIKSVSRVHPSLPPHLSSHTPPKITFRPRTTCKSILHLQPFYPSNHQSMGFQWFAELMNWSFIFASSSRYAKKWVKKAKKLAKNLRRILFSNIFAGLDHFVPSAAPPAYMAGPEKLIKPKHLNFCP